MDRLTTHDLFLIVKSGGGLTMDGSSRSIEDLVLLVKSATEKSHITFTGMSRRPLNELVLIAKNKVGFVTFANKSGEVNTSSSRPRSGTTVLKTHSHGAGLSIAINSSTSTRGRTTAYWSPLTSTSGIRARVL